MIQAAPFILPLAEALGLSVATLGMAKVTDEVNKYVQENPEQAQKLIATIMPVQGIVSAMKTNLPGVFRPDADEMEKIKKDIEKNLKPGETKPIDQGPIKTGETIPPKIETTETLPIAKEVGPFKEQFPIDEKQFPIIFNMKDGKPEFKYPTEEEIKELINEENEFWKKNIENANKQNPQYSPKNMPQVVEADKHFGAAAYTFQNYDDSKLIYMSPDEYLSLTKEHRSEEGKENLGSKTNIKNLETLLKEGKELANIPILYVNKPFEDSDSFEVVGQEGNHRAKAFKNLGYDKIPVVIEGSTREIREKIRDIFPTNIFSFSNYNKDKKEYEQYDSVLTKPTDFYDVLTKEPLFDRVKKSMGGLIDKPLSGNSRYI